MQDFLPAALFGVIAATLAVVYLIAWRWTRRFRGPARYAVRAGLGAAALAPLLLLVITPAALQSVVQSDTAPATAPETGSRPKPPPAHRREKRSARLDPPREEARESALPRTAGRSPGDDERADAPAMKPQASTRAAPSTADAAKWDVVPVFFGTDRKQKKDPIRVRYSDERARRLELGRALVTVPKVHEVPHIERPWVYKLPFTSIVILRESEDPARHFTLKDIAVLSEEEFVKLVRSRLVTSLRYPNHALVFVHGFNTSFDFALYRAAQIAYDLKFDGAPFVYSWPSRGEISPTAYSYDRESAEQAEPHLRKFIEIVAARTGAKSVSVIAHSLGNKLLLPVLRDLKRTAPAGVRISQVILAAPDVDRDGFFNLARQIQGISGGVTLYAAANDRALDVSRKFWGGIPRAGDVPAGGPLVVPGVDTIDVTATSTAIFSLNHSGYAEKSALLKDIELLLKTGERPPEKRLPVLQRVKTDLGDYWRYPG